MNKTSDFFDNLEIFILDTALKKEICNYEYCTDLFNELTIILKKIDCKDFSSRINYDYDLSNISYEIAKYYVKIANLIGSIFNTINPIKDECNLFIEDFKYLYYDVYNYSTNEYDKISEKNMIKYKDDLETFSKYFSKNEVVIKDFSDINLINCNLEINNYSLSLKDDISTIIIMKYANSIIEMISNINKYKKELNEIFIKLVFVKNDTFLIRNVNFTDLNIYINNARRILIKLYSTYNKDKKKMQDIFKMYTDIYYYKNIGCV
tara:strand:+ start:106 stop:897 length:792 start_codon:yes stop_codon:yes gene_type:complete